jgi:dienelactone hydrolase
MRLNQLTKPLLSPCQRSVRRLAMSACCPSSAEPALPCAGSGGVEPRLFGGTRLFVAGPRRSSAGVLAFPNVFGPSSGRTKLDTERLGRLGYAVALVDIADGQYPDPNDPRAMDGWNDWMRAQAFDALEGRVRDAIAFLQTEAGATSISCYGYCWGAWIGASLSASANPVVTGHVSFHPSWVVENLQKGEGAVEELATRITRVPQLLLSAGDDSDFVREGGSVQAILETKEGVVGELSNVVDFPDASHGWVNRGDLEDLRTRANVEKAWAAAIAFTKTVNPIPRTD